MGTPTHNRHVLQQLRDVCGQVGLPDTGMLNLAQFAAVCAHIGLADVTEQVIYTVGVLSQTFNINAAVHVYIYHECSTDLLFEQGFIKSAYFTNLHEGSRNIRLELSCPKIICYPHFSRHYILSCIFF